jgi:hypothetical protein
MATKPKLRIPDGKHRWYCGPFAFATLTGCNFESTRRRLNDMANRPLNAGIRGYKTNNLVKALNAGPFGLRVTEVPVLGKTRFKEFEKIYGEGTFLLELTQHFVLVKDGLFIDNHTKHWVGIDFAPWKMKLVKRVFRVT